MHTTTPSLTEKVTSAPQTIVWHSRKAPYRECSVCTAAPMQDCPLEQDRAGVYHSTSSSAIHPCIRASLEYRIAIQRTFESVAMTLTSLPLTPLNTFVVALPWQFPNAEVLNHQAVRC